MAGAATVEKALDVLFHLHEAGTALGLTEIGKALDLPKSSCHRLLSSLVDREVVERDAGGHYRPGLALLSLGLGAQAREPVVAASRAILEAEVRAFGETVFVVAKRRGRLRVLDKLEGPGFLRASPDVGDVIPADVTAAGQIDRVFGQIDEAGQGQDAKRDTDQDTDGRSDGAESSLYDDVRRAGYATNRDAWIDGLSVLAVPIWQGASGDAPRLAAVLALAAPSTRFETLGEVAIAERLLAAADDISARMDAGGSTGRRERIPRIGRERR